MFTTARTGTSGKVRCVTGGVIAAQLRAKATGVALPRPVASTSKAATTFLVGGSASGVHVPEHLRVLNRLSGSPSKPKRTTVDDLADKITATNFVLAGGPLEKYTNGGKGKPHKKILRMLPCAP
jgi:hypothetical protein